MSYLESFVLQGLQEKRLRRRHRRRRRHVAESPHRRTKEAGEVLLLLRERLRHHRRRRHVAVAGVLFVHVQGRAPRRRRRWFHGRHAVDDVGLLTSIEQEVATRVVVSVELEERVEAVRRLCASRSAAPAAQIAARHELMISRMQPWRSKTRTTRQVEILSLHVGLRPIHHVGGWIGEEGRRRRDGGGGGADVQQTWPEIIRLGGTRRRRLGGVLIRGPDRRAGRRAAVVAGTRGAPPRVCHGDWTISLQLALEGRDRERHAPAPLVVRRCGISSVADDDVFIPSS